MRWANFVFAIIQVFFRKSDADKDEKIVACKLTLQVKLDSTSEYPVFFVHLSHWITNVPVNLLD